MDLTSNRNDVTVDCYIANLDEALTVISQLNLYDYDAIISRGGTATLLSSHVQIPVYDVGLSGLDCLRAVRLAQNFSLKIAVIGYSRITQPVSELCNILDWTYPIITITSDKEARPRLEELHAQGIGVVVCDVISSYVAPLLGMSAVLVTSGYETISSALNQAISISHLHHKSRQEIMLLTQAVQNNPYTCTILDENSQILQSGYQINDPQHLFSFIQDHLEEMLSGSSSEFELSVRGGILSCVRIQRYMNSRRYIFLYTRFHERAETRKIDAITLRSDTPDDALDFTYYNSTHFQTSTQDMIEKYSRSLLPVIMSGEGGTGKDPAAYFIHRKSVYHSSIFFQIDCETATEKNWNYLFSHHDSPLMHNRHTLYFRHIEQLPPQIFQKLLSVIVDTNLASRNRLIFSVDAQDSPQRTSYIRSLMQSMRCLTLRLPPLRERPDDIPYLCTLFITRMNPKMGKQIIGLDARALRAMQSFMWEGNLDQFQRILEQLMLVTSTSQISYEATMRQLSQESALWISDGSSTFQFNLKQPLADINYDIVRQVLKEEDGNHSRASERLGISRSTLWRMLKNHE